MKTMYRYVSGKKVKMTKEEIKAKLAEDKANEAEEAERDKKDEAERLIQQRQRAMAIRELKADGILDKNGELA